MTGMLLIKKLATWIYLVPLGTGLVRYRSLSTPQWVLWGIVLFGGLAEIVAYYAGVKYGTNLPVFHFFILIEFCLYAFLFYKMNALRISWKWLLGIALGFAGGFAWIVLEVQPLTDFPSVSRFSSSLLLISAALIALIIQMRELVVTRLDKLFLFWVCCGMLLFFTSNSLLFLYMNQIAQSAENYKAIWTLLKIFNFTFYSIYTIALLCKDPIPNLYRFSSPREF